MGRSINEISEKLSRSISRMQQDIVRRKRLVRDLSHELKTPIGVIKGYAEGLQFGVADDPEKTARYCGVIAAECDRMDGMNRAGNGLVVPVTAAMKGGELDIAIGEGTGLNKQSAGQEAARSALIRLGVLEEEAWD